jgi:predicted ATPase
VEAQMALKATPWPTTEPLAVRMALHTGLAELRNGDYFGYALSRIARLRDAGHGGQILLSAATAELVHDHLPPAVAVRDLGIHWLRSMARAEQVYQVAAPGLAADFPPLRTLDRPSTNLPAPATSLIGREHEIATVSALLRRDDVRLVTLTGPGGTGKTRLALQVAAELQDSFPDGVWFVDLAPIGDPNLVTLAIAQALGVREIAGQPLLERLKDYLRTKRPLLLLDNFEQVVDAAPAVAALLAGAAGVTILATSRTPLRLAAEREVAVPPLTFPDRTRSMDLERLTQYDSVRLFIERAQAAKASFAVTNESAPAVAEICYRLDGLPLAIELAAARVKLFAPGALLARLEDRLGLLTGGARDLPARQQTIRNAIDWSYRLLDDDQQALFARLGVFVDGWTLPAAEAVCNAGKIRDEGSVVRSELLVPPLSTPVFDGIAALVDHSLVRQVEGSDGEPRFAMLETIRAYALEQLERRGEVEMLRQAHAAWYLALAEEAEPWLRRTEQLIWFSRLRADRANLLAALDWALRAGATELGLRLVGALRIFWDACGSISEARSWYDALLAQSGDAPPAIRAKALAGAGVCAIGHSGHDVAYQLQTESLALARLAGDSVGSAEALRHLAFLAWLRGDLADMHTYLAECEPIVRALGDTWGIAEVLLCQGLDYSDRARSRALTEQSLVLFRQMGNRFAIAGALNNLGLEALSRDDLARAKAMFEEEFAIRQELQDVTGGPAWLGNLGLLAHAQGDLPRATAYIGQSLRQCSDEGDTKACVEMIEELGWIANNADHPMRATRLMAAATTLRDALGYQLEPLDQAKAERNLATARAALGTEAFEIAWAAGSTLTLDQAIAEALEGTA